MIGISQISNLWLPPAITLSAHFQLE